MFAFIFHTSRSRSYLAPFEDMLKRLACEHSLAFAIDFDTAILPYRYEFITTLDSRKFPQNQPERESKLHECVLAFADDMSRLLPVSMDFVFHAIEPREHCLKRFSSAYKPSQKPFVPSVPEIAALLACFAQENPKSLKATLNPENPDSAKWSKLYGRFFSQVRGTLDSPSQTPVHSATSRLRAIKHHELYATIKSLLQLLHQRPITIATPIGSYILSRTPMISGASQTSRTPKSAPESTAIFWDTNALQTFMRVDSLQISFLASVEKPSMRLCPKEVFREQFLPKSPPNEHSTSRIAARSRVEIPCQLAFDPMLMLFGVVAREMSGAGELAGDSARELGGGLEYVFLTKTSSKPHDFAYKLRCLAPAPKLIVCGGDGVYIHEKHSACDLPTIIKRHYPAHNHALESTQPPESTHTTRQSQDPKSLDSRAKDSPEPTSKANPHNPNAKQMLTCYLSTSHQSAIWSYNGAQFFELLPIHFNASETYMLSQLEQYYQGADRLIANYRKHFGEDALSAHPTSQNLDSRNLIDMLALIARTLGYCEKESTTTRAIYALLDSAKLCLRDKGPRIDYKLRKLDSGGLELDYPRILRSCMSFALAGVEKELIAYGVLDSLAEFMGGFVRDVVQNYAMKQVFLCGDMLTHKVFLDKILLYLPRDITLILPQDGWVDSK